MNRIIKAAYLLSIISTLLLLMGSMHFIFILGFPDGHITEYEKMLRVVFKISLFPRGC
jgi:hypothetical protein